METRIVRLSFLGPVHFGRGRLSDSSYACDAATLFSALYIEALHAGVQEQLLDAARCGELALSDAFPYIGGTLYLPKPMVAPDTYSRLNEERMAREGRADSRERKANKKLAYVPATRYGDYLAGTFEALDELGRFGLGESHLQAKVSLTGADGRLSVPYFVGGFSFAAGAGLYFVARGTYDLTPLLEQLSYAGLGGKRTSGYGRFSFDLVSTDPLAQANPHGQRLGASILLSSAAPRPDELTDGLLEGARYQLVRKGGFVQSATHSATPQKKRDLYLFAAGSVFRRTFAGDVFDVNATPGGHPV